MPVTLPCAHGGPPLKVTMRATPEDFRVDEMLGYAADGEGEHVLLSVEKRGQNTDWVARELARFAGVKPLAVGYAGLKDRHAVTTQAFSLQLAGRAEPDWSAFAHDGVRILSSRRHRRKLKRGALKGNRFTLLLRDVQGARDGAETLLAAIAARGVPNYFGAQRFGRGGNNVEQARNMFGNPGTGRRVDRKTRSMLLSAARSQLFNAVLAGRVTDDCWDRALDGEIWSLAGSRSWFGPEPWAETLAQRLVRGDIHPSGPLWGRGPTPAGAEVARRENAVADAEADLVEGLAAAGMQHDRRALRLLPTDLAWQWPDETTLQLQFTLPAGAYATVVVRELAEVTRPGTSG